MSVFKVDEIEISYKRANQRSILPKITTPRDAYEILYNQWDQNRIDLAEDFKFLLLDKQNHVLCICHSSSGGVAETITDPRLVFVAALKTNACSIILAHNHPSGILKPSENDLIATKQLIDVGNLLAIKLLDHLIITTSGCYSITYDARYQLSDGLDCPKYRSLPVLEL